MKKTRTRTLVLAGLTLTLAGLLAAPALAQTYPPEAPTVAVSDGTVDPGQAIVVSGEHWKPQTLVHLSFHSKPISLGTARVGADGSFSTSVEIPASATAGTHDIVASGVARRGGHRVVRTEITVLGETVSAGGTAFTGAANVQVWVLLALALGGAGLVLLVAGWRRRRSEVWDR